VGCALRASALAQARQRIGREGVEQAGRGACMCTRVHDGREVCMHKTLAGWARRVHVCQGAGWTRGIHAKDACRLGEARIPEVRCFNGCTPDFWVAILSI